MLGIGDLGQSFDLIGLSADPLLVRVERSRIEQKLHAAMRQFVGVFGDFGLQLFDQSFVDIPQIAKRNDITPNPAQITQRLHKVIDVIEASVIDVGDDLRGLFFHPRRLFRRIALDAHHFVEFIDRRGRGVLDFHQWFVDPERLRLADPEKGIEHITGSFHQIEVEIGVAVFLLDQTQNLMALCHAADNIFVPDLVEQ